MTTLAEPQVAQIGWLRDAPFDRFFIFGISGIALVSGVVVTLEPGLFAPILAVDLWLLGYHHVISTFTRLCFDASSFRQHRFLVLGLPVIVIFAVFLLIGGVGLWTVTTLYFYWQWFHYTRQSWGISQIYRRKANGLVSEEPRSLELIFYLLPLWGILNRSHQNADTFLGLELWLLPIPGVVVDLVGIAAGVALTWWVVGRVILWYRGRLPIAHTQYMVSHFAVFYVGYVAIESMDAGWLVLNIWHNAQYIALVWFYNSNRFKKGVDPSARFLSTISQARNTWLYLVVCVVLSTVAYLAVDSLVAALIAPIVIFQAANFHHYIVDGLIWKVRRESTRRTLGITS
jgi:hypothetical protein